MTKRKPGQLWAITSYFNPARSRRRRLNYAVFRARLNVPLVAVQLDFGERELGPADADVLVTIPGRDVLWQKERLLNRAMQELPPECQAIVWLDCDVTFFDDAWPELTMSALETWPILQPFSTFSQVALPYSCDPSIRLEPAPTSYRSLGNRMQGSSLPFSIFSSIGSSRRLGYLPGFAWAARREVIHDIGLYDAFILGCGDKALASAAYGRFDDTITVYEMSEPHASHYRQWARRFHGRVSGRVGYADVALAHLWHGDADRRAKRAPYTGLSRFNFDPEADIAIDEGGAWRWANDRPDLQRYVVESLQDRCRDCDDQPPQSLLPQS
jgi:hypothetical protein